MWVVKNRDNLKYVTPAGTAQSYTQYLQKARVFKSKESALRDCCGNEYAIRVEDEIGDGYE